MKALVMTVAALATAFGTAYGLELLFPHPDAAGTAESEMPALERILQQPLAPAPIAPGRAIEPAAVDEDGKVVMDADESLSEDMNAPVEAPTSAPIETAAALQVDPPVAEAPAAEPDAPAEVATAVTPVPPMPAEPDPEPTSSTAVDAASTAVPAETPDEEPAQQPDNRPTSASPAPSARPTPTSPSPEVAADTAVTPAPRPTVPKVSLDAWWADGGAADGLNVIFAGSAAYEPAIVLILSGTLADGAAANRAITVRDIDGNAVAGSWSVSRENNSMLVFPVARGGIYRLTIDGSLGDSRGRTLGRALGGPVHVR